MMIVPMAAGDDTDEVTPAGLGDASAPLLSVDTAYLEDESAPSGLVQVDTDHLPFDSSMLTEQDLPAHPYYNWYTLTLELYDIAESYPSITTLYSAGTSNWGFDIWVLEIGNFDDLSAVPAQDREVLHLDGGHHANEDLGVTLTMLWAQHLTEDYGEDEQATWIVENRHTVLVPLVNPDANHMNNRLNANLVDINRNYPAGWGHLEDNVFTNQGPHPLSEPEPQAVMNVFEAFEPDYVNSFHTGIELMLYPWGYTEELPADFQMFDRICQEKGEADREFCGPVFDTIYPADGITIDTAYERFGAVAWTYEVDDEQFMPGSLEDPKDRMERYWDGVEHAFLNVEKYGAYLNVTEIALDGDLPGSVDVDVTVTNEGYGNLTWADVKVSLPDASTDTYRVGELLPGEQTSFTLTLESKAELEEEGFQALEVGLEYPKRHVAEPMADRSDVVGLTLSEGEILVLDEVPAGEEELSVLAQDEGVDGVPLPTAAVVAMVVGLAGLLLPRRGPQ